MMTILEAAKSLAQNYGAEYARKVPKKKMAFRDLPTTHQKAIMAYMSEGSAWGDLLPSRAKDVKKAIELYGDKPFFMGELAIDDNLKRAIMSSDDFEHEDFEEWVAWYGKHDSKTFKARYKEAWPVILNEPENIQQWGLFEDGWHRFNYYYLAKNKDRVPFVQFVPGIEYADFPFEEACKSNEQRTEQQMEKLGGEFEKILGKKYPNILVSAIEPHYDPECEGSKGWVPDTLHVGLIEVNEGDRGKGLYKAIKHDLNALADQHGVILVTYPTHDFGSDKKRLIELNRSFGFKGPDKNGMMTRTPRQQIEEKAFFSKNDPVQTNGRVIPRKISGTVYHGSSVNDPEEWFDTLDVDDEAAGVWVTPEEEIAKDFSDNRGQRLFFVNKYKLKGMKTAELDQKAYNSLMNRGLLDPEDNMRNALADYLSHKGYSAWLTTGSIMRKTYEDIAIFPGHESEAEYVGTSFKKPDDSWTPYQYFYDQDEVVEFVRDQGIIGSISPK